MEPLSASNAIGCSNDVHREARTRGIAVEKAAVEVPGEFGWVGAPAG